jgi:hypothetical protein
LETSNAVTVKFVGFQHGDYQHAVFETSQGEIISVFTRGEGCFLALNRAEILLVNFLEEEMYIPEAGGYLTVTVVKSIRTVDGSKLWKLGMGSKNYDQKEREKCGKIQAEFIYSESAQ